MQNSYKALSLNPTVYFKVFRDPQQQNPTAIQYWFFYFYHYGQLQHPGDWESITVFLNKSEQASEAAFLNHAGTTRISWRNVETYDISHPVVYVANGYHGSYNEPGTTTYSSGPNGDESLTVNHTGDRQQLIPLDDYALSNLDELEVSSDSWVWFEGRWGNSGGNDLEAFEVAAPFGPRYRKDISGDSAWALANHPPFDPYKGCQPRTEGVNLYGTAENYGPWRWISGYGLDQGWKSEYECSVSPLPLPPSGLNFSITDNVITVQWNSSGDDAAGYFIYFNDEPSNFNSSSIPGSGQNVGNTNRFSVELPVGVYYFALKAYDAIGRTSDYSSTLVVSFDPPTSLPSVPQVKRTGSTGSPGPSIKSVTPVLEWTSVPGSSRYQVDFYNLTESDLILELSDLKSTVYSLPPLIPGHAYRWRVRACNASGCSDYSPDYYFTIQDSLVPPPTLVHHTVENYVVTIKWTNPDNIAGIKAFYGVESGLYKADLDLGNVSQVSAEVGAGIIYLSLRSYDASGKLSPESEEIELTVPSTEPIPSLPTVATPGSLTPPGPKLSSIIPMLDWEPVPEAEYYRVVLKDLLTEQTTADTMLYGFTEFTAPPLALERSYSWIVQACNSAGCSEFSRPRYFRP
ncbi:MAG: fibronectin type III domain-containing protein [Gammaproteobacteria bacterium]